MKNIVFPLFIFVALISCKQLSKDETPENETKKLDFLIENVEDSDKDIHGCLASAGYLWSKLNKECIKLPDVSIHLAPKGNPTNEDETKNVYLIFGDVNEAEVFLPNDVDSKIFIRPNQSDPWIFEDWTLIASNGFVLKKGNEILYSGDGERGPKITGSDKNED